MLDVSIYRKIPNVFHYTDDINQQYHPTGKFSQDSQDIVYSSGNINTTKFSNILLKEWFFMVDTGGYLIIDYIPKESYGFRKLEEEMQWLWRGRYEIVYHGPVGKKDITKLSKEKLLAYIHDIESYYSRNLNYLSKLPQPIATEMIPDSSSGQLRFICKKMVTTQVVGDSINKWTFGIVTNGQRMDWMEDIIKSIKQQNIPNVEIIVCGKYFDRREPGFKYIPFNQRDDLGWITKKKNLIVDAAQYENLCIIHDRALFPKDWFKEMKKYGNCFEIMCNKQYYNGMRAYDWTTLGGKNGTLYKMEMLDYRDWDWWGVIGGLQIISKKHILKEVPLDETRYWNEMEDSELTFNLRDRGYIARINNVSVNTLGFRHGLIPSRPYNKKFYIPDLFLRRTIRNIARITATVPIVHRNVEKFCNTSLYKKITKAK